MRRRFPLALACGLVAAGLGRADDPDKPKPAAKGETVEVPYQLTETKHVMVRAKINGKGPFNLILDTGAPAVFITKAVAKKAKSDTDAKGWANFETFELEGGLKVPGAKGRVEDLFQLEGMNGMGLAGVELHGVIGYNVLAKYRIRYDFTADTIGFEPLPDFDPPKLVPIGGKGQGGLEMIGPLMKTMAALMGIKPNFNAVPRGFVGVEVDDADGVKVTKVLEGSPADKAGFKVGDVVQSVKVAKAADVDELKDLTKALAKAGVGVKLTVTVKRGDAPKDLTLELGKGL
ncbi:MAG: PDZ domain-containing protein [Gemmataceae bacterium]|nr:PDZ domain-containing protein [Gemmataceae bacterium]